MIVEEIRSAANNRAVSVTTSATKLADYGNRRFEALIQNTHGSATLRIGSEAVLAASGGVVVDPGEVYRYMGHAPVYGIGSAALTANVVEIRGPGNHQTVIRENVVAVTTAAKLVAAKDPSRNHCVIENTHATVSITIGNSTVTAGNGIVLAAGKQMDFYGGLPLHAIAASGTVNVRVISEGRR